METWTADCHKCGSSFEHPDRPSETSLRAGSFCPECKGNLKGVLHWKLGAPIDWAEVVEISVCLDSAVRSRDPGLLMQVMKDIQALSAARTSSTTE